MTTTFACTSPVQNAMVTFVCIFVHLRVKLSHLPYVMIVLGHYEDYDAYGIRLDRMYAGLNGKETRVSPFFR